MAGSPGRAAEAACDAWPSRRRSNTKRLVSGGVQLLVYRRPDGRVVAASDEAVCEYAGHKVLVDGSAADSIGLI